MLEIWNNTDIMNLEVDTNLPPEYIRMLGIIEEIKEVKKLRRHKRKLKELTIELDKLAKELGVIR